MKRSPIRYRLAVTLAIDGIELILALGGLFTAKRADEVAKELRKGKLKFDFLTESDPLARASGLSLSVPGTKAKAANRL